MTRAEKSSKIFKKNNNYVLSAFFDLPINAMFGKLKGE